MTNLYKNVKLFATTAENRMILLQVPECSSSVKAPKSAPRTNELTNLGKDLLLHSWS